MENEKIFISAGQNARAEFIPVPVYLENAKWRLASQGVWLGSQMLQLVFIFVIGLVLTGVTFRMFNLNQLLLVMLPALAMSVVFANGSLDLSMGAVSGLVAAVTAKLVLGDVPPGAAVLIAIFLAIMIGLLNAVLIGLARIPGLLVTLFAAIGARFLGFAITEGKMLAPLPDTSLLPVVGWVFFALLAALVVIWIQFPGFNARLAKGGSAFSHVVRIGAPYLLTSLTAGISGLVLMSYVGGVNSFMGQYMEFESLAVIIFAGTCFGSLYGNVVGLIFGALALTFIRFFGTLANFPIPVPMLVIAALALFGLGWQYLYHFIVGLIHRNSLRNRQAAGGPAV